LNKPEIATLLVPAVISLSRNAFVGHHGDDRRFDRPARLSEVGEGRRRYRNSRHPVFAVAIANSR